jgi:hypothetical protein
MGYFGVPIRNGVAIGLGAIPSLKSGAPAAAVPATSAIIQEGSAFYILLEDGVSKILLE